MKLLLDTHLLLWAAGMPDRLSDEAHNLISEQSNELIFSAASIWEIAIKSALGRDDFQVNPRLLRRGLLDNGYSELPIKSEHAVAIDALPHIHKDPFDRILIAQGSYPSDLVQMIKGELLNELRKDPYDNEYVCVSDIEKFRIVYLGECGKLGGKDKARDIVVEGKVD